MDIAQSVAQMIASLDEKQLGEALKALPPKRLAKVLHHLSVGHSLPNSVEYHMIMGSRQLLSCGEPQLTSADITAAERQMMG